MNKRIRRGLLWSTSILLLVSQLHCQAPLCAPGETQVCICNNGLNGSQVCREDRSGWKTCTCTNKKNNGDGKPSDGDFCSTFTQVEALISSKSKSCPALSFTGTFKANVCSAGENLCSDTEQTKSQVYKACIENLPNCTKGQWETWKTSVSTCRNELKSLKKDCQNVTSHGEVRIKWCTLIQTDFQELLQRKGKCDIPSTNGFDTKTCQTHISNCTSEGDQKSLHEVSKCLQKMPACQPQEKEVWFLLIQSCMQKTSSLSAKCQRAFLAP